MRGRPRRKYVRTAERQVVLGAHAQEQFEYRMKKLNPGMRDLSEFEISLLLVLMLEEAVPVTRSKGELRFHSPDQREVVIEENGNWRFVLQPQENGTLLLKTAYVKEL